MLTYNDLLESLVASPNNAAELLDRAGLANTPIEVFEKLVTGNTALFDSLSELLPSIWSICLNKRSKESLYSRYDSREYNAWWSDDASFELSNELITMTVHESHSTMKEVHVFSRKDVQC